MTRRLYLVTQPRVRHVIYERMIWADSPEEAIAQAEQGSSWPESYDERTMAIERGVWTAVEETDP